MYAHGNVIYGFVKITCPPKPKHLISLNRDDDMEVIACFMTLRDRSSPIGGTTRMQQTGRESRFLCVSCR